MNTTSAPLAVELTDEAVVAGVDRDNREASLLQGRRNLCSAVQRDLALGGRAADQQCDAQSLGSTPMPILRSEETSEADVVDRSERDPPQGDASGRDDRPRSSATLNTP